jgi:hypothetical protein
MLDEVGEVLLEKNGRYLASGIVQLVDCTRGWSALARAASKYLVALVACFRMTSVNFFCRCAEERTELNDSSATWK